MIGYGNGKVAVIVNKDALKRRKLVICQTAQRVGQCVEADSAYPGFAFVVMKREGFIILEIVGIDLVFEEFPMGGNDILRNFSHVVPRHFVKEIGEHDALVIILDQGLKILKHTAPVDVEAVCFYGFSV